MADVTKKVDLKDFYPLIQEILASGGSFSLTITGTSMYPTLLGGRDQVTLVRPDRPLGKYDLPLYRRDNGQFILHRIVRVQPDGRYTCCGDHQWDLEPNIRPDQIVGLAASFCRKGKTFSHDKGSYRLWVRLWVGLLPCRKVLFRAAGLGSALKRKLLRKK